jgi:tRNA(Met) cytidine acetyltransferase
VTALQLDSIEQLAGWLLAQARSSRQRRVLLLAGERTWAIEQARRALAAADLLAGAGWLGDLAPDTVTPVAPSRVSRLLGRELPALVVDAYAGFDPDAVGAAIGALCGGGLLLLLTPPLAQWADYPDPQHARIAVAP